MVKEKVNKNVILSLLVLVLFYLGIGYSRPARSSHNEKWVCVDYDNNNRCDVYYDRYDIHQVYPSVFNVWTKWYGEKVKKLSLKLAIKEGLPANSFDNFDYQLALDRINCINQTDAWVSFYDYDTDGNVIFSFDFSGYPLDYSPIPPGTIIYAIYKAVCKGR